MLWADNSVKIWWNLPISNPKPDLHNINAQTKFGENPLLFTQVIIRKQKTDRQTDLRLMDGWMDKQTDRHTDVQCETKIPCHYHVAGYKNSPDQFAKLALQLLLFNPTNFKRTGYIHFFFYSFFYKVGNNCDFLFAFQHSKLLLKMGLL